MKSNLSAKKEWKSFAGLRAKYDRVCWNLKPVALAHEILVRYLGPYFAVPVFVWIVATFRREDWARILGAVEPAMHPPASK